MAHDHPHHQHHDRRFPFHKAHKLDDVNRKSLQPAELLVAAMAKDPSAVVLDLGAGTGYFAIPLAKAIAQAGGNGKVIAADIEPRMLDIVAERAEAAKVASHIHRLPIPEDAPSRLSLDNQSVDGALLANLWHELTAPAESLAELRRVLRQSGHLWIVDWDPKGTTEIGPPVEHRVPAHEVEKALTAAGFRDVRRLELYPHHYVLEARRP